MGEINLVAATPEDAPMLAAMSERLAAVDGGGPSRSIEAGAAAMTGMLATIYKAVLVRVAGRVAGYVLWREDADHTHIRHFYLEPKARGTGTGRAVFAMLTRRWLRKDQPLYLDVMDGNDAALAFWQRMGCVRQAASLEWRPDAAGGV